MDLKQVVLVEDDHLHRKLYREWLRVGGYLTSAVADERSAIDRLTSVRPALAIVDIRLRQSSGIDLIARMKRTPELADVPVLALTVYGADEMAQACRNAGADDYLNKSVAMDRFLDVVDRLTAEPLSAGR